MSSKCPKCRRVQYFVCSRLECACAKNVPKGKLAQIWADDGERLSCPYCGFIAHADYWEERSIQGFIKEMGAKTLTEAIEILGSQ